MTKRGTYSPKMEVIELHFGFVLCLCVLALSENCWLLLWALGFWASGSLSLGLFALFFSLLLCCSDSSAAAAAAFDMRLIPFGFLFFQRFAFLLRTKALRGLL